MPRFGHGRCRHDGVANDVHIFGLRGFKRLVIHAAPTRVGIGQTRLHRNTSCPHSRQHIEHIGFDIVLNFEFQGAGLGVNRGHIVLRDVFQNAFVVVCPKLLEQRPLRSHVLVRIQDQHFRFGFVLLEVMRDLACALIGPRRATVRSFRNADSKHATVWHIYKLFAKVRCFCSGFPSLQNLSRGIGLFKSFNGIEHEFDTRRKYQLVVADAGATG